MTYALTIQERDDDITLNLNSESEVIETMQEHGYTEEQANIVINHGFLERSWTNITLTKTK